MDRRPGRDDLAAAHSRAHSPQQDLIFRGKAAQRGIVVDAFRLFEDDLNTKLAARKQLKHKTDFWKQIFPTLVVHETVAVRTRGDIAWAFRKNSPQLKAALIAALRKEAKYYIAYRLVLESRAAQQAALEQRKKVAECVKAQGVTEVTYYRWR